MSEHNYMEDIGGGLIMGLIIGLMNFFFTKRAMKQGSAEMAEEMRRTINDECRRIEIEALRKENEELKRAKV